MQIYQTSYFCYSHGNLGSHRNIWISDIYLTFLPNNHVSYYFSPHILHIKLSLFSYFHPMPPLMAPNYLGGASVWKSTGYKIPGKWQVSQRTQHLSSSSLQDWVITKIQAMLLIPGRRNIIQTSKNAKWCQVPWRKIRQGEWMRSAGAKRVVIVIV